MQIVFEFFRAMAVFTDAGDPLQGAVYLVERDDGGAGEDYAGCAIFSGNYFRLPVDRGVREPLCKSELPLKKGCRNYSDMAQVSHV